MFGKKKTKKSSEKKVEKENKEASKSQPLKKEDADSLKNSGQQKEAKPSKKTFPSSASSRPFDARDYYSKMSDRLLLRAIKRLKEKKSLDEEGKKRLSLMESESKKRNL